MPRPKAGDVFMVRWMAGKPPAGCRAILLHCSEPGVQGLKGGKLPRCGLWRCHLRAPPMSRVRVVHLSVCLFR